MALNLDLDKRLGIDGSVFIPRYRVFADVNEYEEYARNCAYPLTEYVSENALPLDQRGSALVALQISDVRQILHLLQSSAGTVLDDYSEKASHDLDGSNSFQKLLVNVHEWAKQSGFKSTMMRKDQTAGPLARFIFEFVRMFPENIRPNPASPEAIAKSVQRARATVGHIGKKDNPKMSTPV